MSCPTLLLEGTEDKVVPPAQAELMREELSRKGKPVALVMFEGEQHGFRRQENIEACLRGTFYFQGRFSASSQHSKRNGQPILRSKICKHVTSYRYQYNVMTSIVR